MYITQADFPLPLLCSFGVWFGITHYTREVRVLRVSLFFLFHPINIFESKKKKKKKKKGRCEGEKVQEKGKTGFSDEHPRVIFT